jgi:hypothetical protein
MSSLLGFIQLLLVLVPTGNKKQKPICREESRAAIVTLSIDVKTPATHQVFLPAAILQAAPAAVTQDDKGLPACLFSFLEKRFLKAGNSQQELSCKPCRFSKLYILFCRLKSDCRNTLS